MIFARNQYLIYRLVPNGTKTDKIPLDWRTMKPRDAGDSAMWLDFPKAKYISGMMGPGYGVGFYFSESDPYFFLDIDHCKDATTGQWTQTAQTLVSWFPGACVEISQSGEGLHVFGTYHGDPPAHGCDNKLIGAQFYTEGRFAALTFNGLMGSADLDFTDRLGMFAGAFFPVKVAEVADWTTEPVPQWSGPEDDDELIKKAKASKSAASVMGGKAGFKELWEGDAVALGVAFPDDHGQQPYDASDADAALAQHLAFWAGGNCERIQRLMERSALAREKWELRPNYLRTTILKAVGMQKVFYGGPKLRGKVEQVRQALGIIAEKGMEVPTGPGPGKVAEFWIKNQDKTPEELDRMMVAAPEQRKAVLEPELVLGYQYLGATNQIELFKGCVYVQDAHKILVPSGALLRAEQFNASYGGYVYQVDDSGTKTTKKAFEAFTESQVVRFPKADSSCFRPRLNAGQIFRDTDGTILVNRYIPIDTPCTPGDASRFLNHAAKVLPDERDRTILLSYMAACVQYKGVKFKWAPLIQGVEGNGKSLFTACMVEAIGKRYSFVPQTQTISEKFNSWMFNTLFIGIEDIYIAEQKREIVEILKPMITGEWGSCRAMQKDQDMREICCNFLFNSNHKDAVRKTGNDRRFCIMYSAQQEFDDIQRDGMGGRYFPDLYDWLKFNGGFAVVNSWLMNYQIPDEYNPAGMCQRAPVTSTTHEVLAYSMGAIEQEIIEAIEEGRPGFAGGWASSMAVDNLLKQKRKDGFIPHNRRREMMQTLGYILHPALADGRVNNPVSPDGGKPRLFIMPQSPHVHLKTAKQVADAYESDQTKAVMCLR